MGLCCDKGSLPSNGPRVPIPKKIREAVWEKYYRDSDDGACYCCGTDINRLNRGWHCAHVVAYVKGGRNEVNNLRTCCPKCNLSMGDQNLYVYIQVKGLTGPGSQSVKKYLEKHPSQQGDTRTNNWVKNKKNKGTK